MRLDRTALTWRAAGSLALAIHLLVAGAGEARVRPMDPERLRSEIQARGIDPATLTLPTDLTEEMRAWVDRNVPKRGTKLERLEALLAGLSDGQGRAVQYQSGYTGTAAEVFASRKANCLAFTHLFVAMARHAGISVYYLGVEEVQGFHKEGDLVIVSDHITSGFGRSQDRRILEFTVGPDVDYRRVQPISDLRALALYYSNRGAEQLRDDELPEALRSLEIALKLESELASAWVNTGVAHRRRGNAAAAEAAYRRALQADPTFVTAYHNLASLLRSQHRQDEEAELLERIDEIGSRNPYIYLSLGDLSASRGQMEDARSFYRKAWQRDRKNAEAVAALGLWELAMGNREEARRWLERARKIGADADRVETLEQRLSGKPTEVDLARLISSKKKIKRRVP